MPIPRILFIALVPFCLWACAAEKPLAKSEIAGLFMTQADKARILEAVEAGREPWSSSYQALIRSAEGQVGQTAQPFSMDDLSQIRFGWCGKKSPPDDTLSELADKLDRQGGSARDLALAYSFTGDDRFAKAAEQILLSWEKEGQIVNLYEFNIDFKKATFDGLTSDGFCGDRPWNFALDAMWQTYGLIGMSDAYVLLKEGGYAFEPENEELIRKWILSLAEAVNSSFHAWTRWADSHKGASSVARYRSDNHLSWSLAGLMAAAIALEDDDLAEYVLDGGTWLDAKSGTYQNPSYIADIIDRSIEGGEYRGRIYEEKIGRKPPIGYSFFHLWPMSLVATMAEKRYERDLWSFEGEDDAGLKDAYERYAGFVLGVMDSPKPEQEGSRTDYAWLFEIAASVWPEEPAFRQARDKIEPGKSMRQAIGPVTLLYRSGEY